MVGSNRALRQLARLERPFSANQYNGGGKDAFEISAGSVPVLVSAPHPVNHFREGSFKDAELLTGAIARFLGRSTGCHVACVTSSLGYDANYSLLEQNQYQQALVRYVKENDIRVLLDLHGASLERPFAIELGTVPTPEKPEGTSLQGHSFIARLIKYSFEYEVSSLGVGPDLVWENQIFSAGRQQSVTRTVSENTSTSCVQIEINARYRTFEESHGLLALVRSLERTIRALSRVDWDAEVIEVLRLFRTKEQRPQDVAYVLDSSPLFRSLDGRRLARIGTGEGVGEKAYLRPVSQQNLNTIANHCGVDSRECIFLTNRLIGLIHTTLPGESSGVSGGPEGIPVIVSLSKRMSYPIGVPKADVIDHVTLSSRLYQRLSPSGSCGVRYDYAIYNRYTDSALYLDMDRADYADNGHIKKCKVMLPRYYRELLSLQELPLSTIRQDELVVLLRELSADDRHLFERSYKPIDGTAFECLSDALTDEDRSSLAILQKKLGVNDAVELVRWPHDERGESRPNVVVQLKRNFLKHVVGSTSYDLRTTWTSLPDDAHNVCRLSPYMMSLLGVSDYGKVEVCFSDRVLTLRVMRDSNLSDVVVGIPALARKELRLNSVNDVVTVSRNMEYIFACHSEEQVIVILGTILTVMQVAVEQPLGIIVAAICVPFLMFFSLNSERSKVNR